MSKFFDFENLLVWQESVLLIEMVYELGSVLPKSEEYGLVNQMKRAANSISLNIAEGKGRFNTKDYIRFLFISRGSLYELVACLKIIEKLKISRSDRLLSIYEQTRKVQKMISGLISSLK